MDLLGIAPLADRLIGKLSGGQQQRVLLARALVHEPQIIILDEPTVALDPQSRETFYATLSDLHKTHGVTVLMISHDISSVGAYASKLIFLDQRLIFCGSFEAYCNSEAMAGYFKEEQHLIRYRQN